MPGDFSFDLKLARARDEINDALGVMQNQRFGAMNTGYQPQPQGPMPSMNVQADRQRQMANINMPMGGGFSAGAQLGGGMINGRQAPYGVQNVGLNYNAPSGFAAGVGYQPQQKLLGASMRVPFQEGGLATSVRNDPVYHERDVDFINTRNQHMREVAGKEPYAKGGLAVAGPASMSDEELAKAFGSEGNNSAIIGEVNRRIKAKLLDKFGGDEAAANQFLRTTNDPLGILLGRAAYAKGGGAWTRKEGKNPEGGLNAVGRASLRAQGHDIKPPVSAKQAKKSPKAAARRKSFCARMSGMPGPMKDEKGRPTRKALSLRKWDC